MKIIHLVQLVPVQAQKLRKKSAKLQLYDASRPGEYYVSQTSLAEMKKSKATFQILQSYSQAELPIEVVYPARSFLFEPPDPEACTEAMTYALSKRESQQKIQLQYLGRHRHLDHESFTLDRPGGKRSYRWYIPERPQRLTDIRKQFPKIARRFKDKNTKVIISLGSGGIRLFAHPALLKFMDLLELRPYIDEIWGSSGGAIAGLPYSLGVEPSTIEQEGYHLYNERYSFRFSPSKLEVVKNLFSDVFLASTDTMLQGFLDCQENLRQLLEKHLTVTKRTIPFYCIAYNLKERRNEVLTPEKINPNHYRTPILQTDAMDAVLASSAIPILYVPKKIKRHGVEHSYIDGGTTEEVPLLSPYRKWVRDCQEGREKRKKLLILSVNLFPTVGTSNIFTHWVFKRIPVLKVLQLSATYADLVRQARIDEHKNTLARDPNVTQWELKLPDTGSGIVNTKLIPKIIETAQYSFYEQLRGIEKDL